VELRIHCVALVLSALAVAYACDDVGAVRLASAVRVVDRSFVCSVPRPAGYPDPGVATIRVGGGPEREEIKLPATAYVYAGGPAGNLVLIEGGPAAGRPTGGVYVNRKYCDRLKDARIPLTHKGLRGGSNPYGKGFRCIAGSVVVRVRALLDRPAGWTASGEEIKVRANIVHGYLAVQRISRPSSGSRPPAVRTRLALAVMNEARESKVWASSRCNRT
jgi:hypothetical protein